MHFLNSITCSRFNGFDLSQIELQNKIFDLDLKNRQSTFVNRKAPLF
jgi:hypothetical protein